MHFATKKTGVAALGLALAASLAGGAAVAAGADDWYVGGNATVPDAEKTGVALKLYDAAGAEVTSGSTTAPLAAFAAAGGAVRTGDEFASLFVHLPQSGTAPGAWPGVQVTGTDRFAGTGAVAAPAALAAKPYVRTTAAGYSLADVAQALPNTATGESIAGVYELRLRTSSPANGVADKYAAAYVKVAGTTWTLTDAPVLGGGDPPAAAVATSVAVSWPAKLTYGAAATVKVTVTPASGTAKPSGTVRLQSGSATLGSAVLSAAGTASLTVPRTALLPGARVLTVSYAGVASAFGASASAPRTLAVAKAVPGRPKLKVTKKATAKVRGAATLTVPVASGLSAAGGKAQVVLKKGRSTKKVTVTVVAGRAKVKLPKLTAGTWTASVTYLGDAKYAAAKSGAVKLKVKKK